MSRVAGDWLTRPATQTVMAMLTDAGAQAWLVGGCVRNALIGAAVDDIDICTDARPDRVMALADQAGLRAIPTGLEHGTVTVVADGIPHEITTFRADVDTDGRHATVRFSDSLDEDAKRRDFTMNALYADAQGFVRDPVQGLPDLAARRVRFIGEAQDRIREDYLRTLRFFRFHAWYGDAAQGFDTDALDAIARNLDGLATLSRERVTQELLKLLSAADPARSLAGMAQTGTLAALLPGAVDRTLPILVHLERQTDTAPDPIRRLVSLGTGDWDLRLSKHQARAVDALRNGAGSAQSAGELGYRQGAEVACSVLLLRAASLEMRVDAAEMQAAEHAARQTFPVRAADLPHLSGPALGAALKRLEQDWIASGFSLTKAALIAKA